MMNNVDENLRCCSMAYFARPKAQARSHIVIEITITIEADPAMTSEASLAAAISVDSSSAESSLLAGGDLRDFLVDLQRLTTISSELAVHFC